MHIENHKPWGYMCWWFLFIRSDHNAWYILFNRSKGLTQLTMSPTGNLPDREAARQGYIPIGDHHCPRGWPAGRAHCGVRHWEAAGAAQGRPPQQWRLYWPRYPLIWGRGRWRDQRWGMQLRPSRCLVRCCWGHPSWRWGSAAVQLELLVVEQLIIGGWLDGSMPHVRRSKFSPGFDPFLHRIITVLIMFRQMFLCDETELVL